MQKYCFMCKQYHDIGEFGLKPSSPDGHKRNCKKWTKEKETIEKEVIPDGYVEKVCPTCKKHIWVNPLDSEGTCSKCDSVYYLSPSWTAKNGVDIWIPKRKNVSEKVISFIESNQCVEKKQLLGCIEAHRVTVGTVLSNLKEKGVVREKWENHKCYVELVS